MIVKAEQKSQSSAYRKRDTVTGHLLLISTGRWSSFIKVFPKTLALSLGKASRVSDRSVENSFCDTKRKQFKAN